MLYSGGDGFYGNVSNLPNGQVSVWNEWKLLAGGRVRGGACWAACGKFINTSQGHWISCGHVCGLGLWARFGLWLVEVRLLTCRDVCNELTHCSVKPFHPTMETRCRLTSCANGPFRLAVGGAFWLVDRFPLQQCTLSLLSALCLLFHLAFSLLQWMGPFSAQDSTHSKSDPASFYSVNRRVVYCGQLRRPQCFNAVLHDHQSHRQQLRQHRVSRALNYLTVFILKNDFYLLKINRSIRWTHEGPFQSGSLFLNISWDEEKTDVYTSVL